MTSNKSVLFKDILIIIPAKNEYLNLKKLFNHLKKYKINKLIVDDNSDDNTDKIRREFSNLKIIKNKTSKGYDFSIKKGLLFAKSNYKYAITIDADFEHDPKYIPKFINSLKYYKIVIGNRDRKNRIFEKLFGFILNKKYYIKDLFCGYRAINLALIDKKKLNSDIDIAKLIYELCKKNFPLKNINIRSKKRVDKSRFGNCINGNLKIIYQFIKIFF